MSLNLDKSNWKRVAFGDVVTNLNATVRDSESAGIERVIAMEHLDPSDLKIRRWSSVQDGTTFTRRVRPGQTLFGKRRVYQRKAAFAEFDAVTSGDILVFEADETQLLPKFLPFLVQSDGFYDHALGTSAGSLSPRTNWRDLASYEFDLPPLDEQKRLADLVWALEQHRNTLATEREQVSTTRTTWLSHEIEQLVQQGTVPFERVWAASPESGRSAPPVDHSTGRYVLSLAALGPEGYRPGHLKNVTDTPDVQAATLTSGDLLVSRANTADLVGRAGIFDEPREDVSFPDTMLRLRLVEGVMPKFAEAVLSSTHGRAHMRRTAAGSATSMVKINRKSLAKFSFPFVSNDQQVMLLKELSRFDHALEALDHTLQKTVRVKMSLLARIFGGSG